MLRILLCDDDLTSRFVLKRFVTREIACTVTEADNGVGALQALARERFDLLILDLHMPMMNGQETLQVIRDTPDLRDIPVVVLTAEKDEAEVRQVIRLGVQAFLLKPVVQNGAQARLRDVLAGLRPRVPAATTKDAPIGPVLHPGQPLLVADGDEDFRHMVASVLGHRFEIVEASNGVDALDAVMKQQIPAVLVGRQLPLLKPDALASKLHALATHVRVVAMAPKIEADAVRASGLYDAVLLRTFIPDVFEAQVEELLHEVGDSCLDRLRALVPGFRGHLITAVQQLLGMAMRMDADPIPAVPDGLGGPFVRAEVHLLVEDEFDITVALLCDQESARTFAAATASGAMPADALREMVNTVAGRLEHAMTSAGLGATHAEPTVCEADASHAVPAPGESLALNFGVAGHSAYLSALVSVVAREAPVGDA